MTALEFIKEHGKEYLKELLKWFKLIFSKDSVNIIINFLLLIFLIILLPSSPLIALAKIIKTKYEKRKDMII